MKKRSSGSGLRRTILVVGDFMLDRTWIVTQVASTTSQAHGEVLPHKRVHPGLQNTRLGGAGMCMNALTTLCPNKLRICGIGVWDAGDEDEMQSLAMEPAADRGGAVAVSLISPKLPAPKPDAERGHTITTIKQRYFMQIAEDEPRLSARFDQDPLERNHPDYPPDFDIWSHLKGEGITPDDVIGVVICDFNKGLFQHAFGTSLLAPLTDDCFCILDTKNPTIFSSSDPKSCIVPPGRVIDLLSINRDELTALFESLCDLESPDLSDMRHPTREFLETVKKVGTELKGRVRQLLIKLDSAGACVIDLSTDELQVTFLSCNSPVENSPGIAAGDFMNARIAAAWTGRRGTKSGASRYGASDVLESAATEASRWLRLCRELPKNNLQDYFQCDIAKPHFLARLRKSKQRVHRDVRERIDQEDSFTTRVFTLVDECDKLSAPFSYEKIRTQDFPQIDVSNAKGFLGDFVSTDSELRTEINRFVRRIRNYSNGKGQTRPLNCLVAAQPGSGKSFFVKQVAKAANCDVLEVNCSQALSPEHLLKAIARLRNSREGTTPLLFLDEADTDPDLFAYMLGPLWDASVSVDGVIEQWKPRTVSILVVSKETSADAFVEFLRSDPPSDKPDKRHDLLSRLNGPRLTLAERGREDETLTSRVYLTVDMICRYHGNARNVSRGLTDLVYAAPAFNPRTLENFIIALTSPADGNIRLIDSTGSTFIRNESRQRLSHLLQELGYDLKRSAADRIDYNVVVNYELAHLGYDGPECPIEKFGRQSFIRAVVR